MTGPGGHVFKIGECHVYPKTKIYDLATSLPDVVFDQDGVFGQNIVRQPSKNLNFEAVLSYNREIFNLSNMAPKIQKTFLNIMPLFRIPALALTDDMIPAGCYSDDNKAILDVKGKSLSVLKEFIPILAKKYTAEMAAQRSSRHLNI